MVNTQGPSISELLNHVVWHYTFPFRKVCLRNGGSISFFFLQVLQEDKDPMKSKKHDKRKLFLVEDWPQLGLASTKEKKDYDVNDQCKTI